MMNERLEDETEAGGESMSWESNAEYSSWLSQSWADINHPAHPGLMN